MTATLKSIRINFILLVFFFPRQDVFAKSDMTFEARQKLQQIQFPFSLEDTGEFWQQRWILNANTRIAPSSFSIVELIYAEEQGSDSNLSGANKDRGDLHQFNFHHQPFGGVEVVVGRQIWGFANQRQVGTRGGTNVKRRFDGVYTSLDYKNINTEIFYGKHVSSDIGPFDDGWDGQKISGINNKYGFGNRTISFDVLHYAGSNAGGKIELASTRFAMTHRSVLVTELEAIAQFYKPYNKLNGYWVFLKSEYGRGIACPYLIFDYASGGNSRSSIKEFNPIFGRATYYTESGFVKTTNVKSVAAGLKLTGNHDQFYIEYRELLPVTTQSSIYFYKPIDVKNKNSFADVINAKYRFSATKNTEFAITYSAVTLKTQYADLHRKRFSYLELEVGYQF